MEVNTTTAASARDEFMQLLVTQLQHQDPLDPVKQEDFISQLAQFSTLEGIEDMNTNFASQLEIQTDLLKLQQFSQAATMVGQEISYELPNGTTGVGRVDSVNVSGNSTELVVGTQTLSIDDVTSVLAQVP